MKSNTLILNIISVLGLLLWACGFFFGLNYAQGGALMVSISISVFVLLIMGALIFALKKHSNNAGGNAWKSQKTEKLTFVVYLIVTLASAIYICHFVNVTMNVQSEVQGKAQQSLQELGRIFDDSDVPVAGSYIAWVLDEEDNYERKLASEDMTPGTIEKEKKELEDVLINTSGFSDLQTEVQDFLSHCQYSVENWVWITIPNYLTQLEEKKPEYESKVVECSKKSEYTKNEPYNCNAKYNFSGLARELTSVSADDFTFMGCVLVLILQFMILLTYFSGRPANEENIERYKSRRVRTYKRNDDNKEQVSSSRSNNETEDFQA